MSSLPHSLGRFFEHIPVQEKVNFIRHLSIVVKAGLPLLEGLKIIQRQVTSRTLKALVPQVIVDVNNGQFLADSLSRHRHLFGDFFINIIRVGEASGTLSLNLSYLADELEKSQNLRRTVRSALVYPIVVLIATLGITGLLTFFVFPKVLPVFTSLRITLPLTTRILIAVLQFLLHYGGWLVLGIVLIFVLIRLLFSIERVKYLFDRTLFLIPVVSTLMVNVNMASLARVLGVLLKSGIKIVEALTITSQTFNNLVYRRIFEEAAEEVRRGVQFSAYLANQHKFFPPLFSGMVEIGENTGNLEENLSYLSEYYTKEVEVSVKDLTTLLEPMLLLLMGVIVGFVALSIITPVYEITQNLHP